MRSQRIHRSEFVRQLKLEFPEALPFLDSMRDGLTLEMDGFTSFAADAIDRGDYETVTRCFRFADRLLEQGNRAVRNAVAVVFLEHLRFEGRNGAKAHQLLTSRLRQEWDAVHEYLHELVGAEPPKVGTNDA